MHALDRSERRRRMLTSACVSAVVYGGWAHWTNRLHGFGVALRVTAVQALWSAVITVALTVLIERVAVVCASTGRDIRLSALPALVLVWIGPFTVHTLAGTPEIIDTIAPGVTIGTIFVFSYAANLARKRLEVAS